MFLFENPGQTNKKLFSLKPQSLLRVTHEVVPSPQCPTLLSPLSSQRPTGRVSLWGFACGVFLIFHTSGLFNGTTVWFHTSLCVPDGKENNPEPDHPHHTSHLQPINSNSTENRIKNVYSLMCKGILHCSLPDIILFEPPESPPLVNPRVWG